MIINGKYISKRSLVDMEESFTSDKQKQSKLEKIEQEYNRIIQRNGGQLFTIKNERLRQMGISGKSD